MAADKWDALKDAVKEGRLTTASREELERFARTVCLPQAYSHFSGPQWTQVTETIRLMLLVRLTEDLENRASKAAEGSEKRALAVAKAAMWIAAASFGVSILQGLIPIGSRLVQPERSQSAPAQSGSEAPLSPANSGKPGGK